MENNEAKLDNLFKIQASSILLEFFNKTSLIENQIQ
jgi:hypothetical protein